MKNAKEWYDRYLKRSQTETGKERAHYERLSEEQAFKILKWKEELNQLKKKMAGETEKATKKGR